MNWQALITTLGGTGILVAALAWLSRSLISSLLTKDFEKYKAELKSKSELAIEEFKSSMQLESQKRIIEYTSLHGKRAEVIADLYSRLFQLQGWIQRLLFEYQHREIREDLDKKYYQKNREEWKLVEGIHTLSAEEEQKVKELSSHMSELYEFYGKYKIYFSSNTCDLIDRFSTLASYLATNYQNVALKDNDGNLYVNPDVKVVWDRAIETIPTLLVELEKEFRSILGVDENQSLTSGSTRRS